MNKKEILEVAIEAALETERMISLTHDTLKRTRSLLSIYEHAINREELQKSDPEIIRVKAEKVTVDGEQVAWKVEMPEGVDPHGKTVCIEYPDTGVTMTIKFKEAKQ